MTAVSAILRWFMLKDPRTRRILGLALPIIGGTASQNVLNQVATGLQWGLFLPAAWLVGPVLGGGLSAVWIAQVAYRAVQTVAFALLWRRRGWARVEV